MPPVPPERLSFPPKAALVSYFERHPSTSIDTNSYLYEKKIIAAVADVFAETTKVLPGVTLGVELAMIDLNETLSLRGPALSLIKRNLIEALVDCAAGKVFSAEKETKK